MRTTVAGLILLLGVSAPLCAGTQVLVGWEFAKDGELEGWRASGHVADVRVADGALACRVVDWDPIFTSPLFEIPARHSEWIETRIRANHSGMAEFLCSGALRTK